MWLRRFEMMLSNFQALIFKLGILGDYVINPQKNNKPSGTGV